MEKRDRLGGKGVGRVYMKGNKEVHSRISAPHSKNCMIRAGAACTVLHVLYMHTVVLSSLDIPVKSRLSTFMQQM